MDNYNLDNDNFTENNETNDKYNEVEEAISYFPASYLTYIIDGFLPKIANKPNYIFHKITDTSIFKYYYEENKNEIKNVIKYSGKSYPDFGDEEGCIRNNMAFILFCIHFNINNSSHYEGKFPLLPFISNGYSFYGLCIKNESNFTSLSKDLELLINKDESIKDIYHLETFINRNKSNVKDDYKATKFTIFQILVYLNLIFIILRLIITLLGMRIFKDKEKIGNSSSSSSDEEEEEEEEEFQEKNKRANLNNEEKGENSQLLIEKNEINNNISNKQRYKLLYFVYIFCSFKHGYENLFKYKTYLFNETDLYIILFFRFFSFICKTCYMNFISIVFTPSKEINNTQFFHTNFMSFVKYTSFSDIIFILTESIIMSYKLMSFIRKYTEKGREPSFKLLMNFFFRIMPSIATVFNIFFLFYFFSKEQMLFSLSESNFQRTRLQHYLHNIIDCQSCINNIYNLIPFYMQ